MDSSSLAMSSTTSPTIIMPSPASFINNISHNVTAKLTHENFITWHYQMTTYLRAQQVYGFVDGTVVPPTQTIPKS